MAEKPDIMNLDGLDDVRRLYNAAELALKRYERINLENNPHVLDTLREASRYLLAAVGMLSENPQRELTIEKAKSLSSEALIAVRADAMAGMLENIDAILKCDGLLEKDISSVVQDWDQVKADVGAIRKRWSDDSFVSCLDDCELHEKDYQRLHEIREQLSFAEPRLRGICHERLENERLAKQTKMDNKRGYRQKCSDVCALAEELAGGLSIVLTLFCAVMGVLGFGWKRVLVCLLYANLMAMVSFGTLWAIASCCVAKSSRNQKQC